MVVVPHPYALGELDGYELVEALLDDEVYGYTLEQLCVAARDFVRLREAIRMTMADQSDWEDEESTVAQLRAYLDHLTLATRGVCELCDRAICAPHLTTTLPRRPWWHPQRWRHALTDAWSGLRYGRDRIAHTSCVPRHF